MKSIPLLSQIIFAVLLFCAAWIVGDTDPEPSIAVKLIIFLVLPIIALIMGVLFMVQGTASKLDKTLYIVGSFIALCGLLSFTFPQEPTTINVAGGGAIAAGVLISVIFSVKSLMAEK